MTAFLTRPSAPAPHLEALLLLLTSASPHYNGKLVSYSVPNAQPAPSYHVRVKVSRAKNKQEVSKDSPCSEFPGQLLSLLEEAPQCHEVGAMRWCVIVLVNPVCALACRVYVASLLTAP